MLPLSLEISSAVLGFEGTITTFYRIPINSCLSSTSLQTPRIERNRDQLPCLRTEDYASPLSTCFFFSFFPVHTLKPRSCFFYCPFIYANKLSLRSNPPLLLVWRGQFGYEVYLQYIQILYMQLLLFLVCFHPNRV